MLTQQRDECHAVLLLDLVKFDQKHVPFVTLVGVCGVLSARHSERGSAV